MKTIKFLSATLLLVASFTFAQSGENVQFGVKAGANLATLTGSSVTSNQGKFGAYAGLYTNFHISDKVKLQGEVLYSGQGTKWVTETQNYTIVPPVDRRVDQNITLNYINIPVVVQYEFTKGLYGEIGPQFCILLSANDKKKITDIDHTVPAVPVMSISETNTDIKSALTSTDYSGVVGVGYRMDNGLNFNFRYAIGFVDIAKSPSVQAKNSVMSLGLGYTL